MVNKCRLKGWLQWAPKWASTDRSTTTGIADQYQVPDLEDVKISSATNNNAQLEKTNRVLLLLLLSRKSVDTSSNSFSVSDKRSMFGVTLFPKSSFAEKCFETLNHAGFIIPSGGNTKYEVYAMIPPSMLKVRIQFRKVVLEQLVDGGISGR